MFQDAYLENPTEFECGYAKSKEAGNQRVKKTIKYFPSSDNCEYSPVES